MLPSILAEQLKIGIEDYIDTTYPMANEPFRGSIRRMFEANESVYHEPFFSVRLPFRVSENTDEPVFESIQIPFQPYVHQKIAFDRLTGNDVRSTIIATGTGSGKTECFIYPILDYCYRHRGERGIKALIIYPMNALATDQAKRIAKLIHENSELRGNVTAGMYVGGFEGTPSRLMSENTIITDRETILNQPPDILLTNYKMLDYLLVRHEDARLWKENHAETLKYIAVDELHTFDGAQGTDLACLIRRLKSRLNTPLGYLCCIGTSATIGSEDATDSIRKYAKDIFGEPFENDAIVTEDRLSAEEFLDGSDITDYTLPTSELSERLGDLTSEDNKEDYLRTALSAWTSLSGLDVSTDEARVEIARHLMHHNFTHSLLRLVQEGYYQVPNVIEELSGMYPELGNLKEPQNAINALLALISYARTGEPGHLRPFLNVQIYFWLRELRRVVAKVSSDDITYSVAPDLNSEQAKYYLPVVNCRHCGMTGWASTLNERQNASISELETFYNLYFKGDKSQITTLYPFDHEDVPDHIPSGYICPSCMHVQFSDKQSPICENCGSETINVLIPKLETSGSENYKQFVCPFCGSKRGLALMGIRSTTEISALLSQIFTSKFNDDKKTLAFSDNVQDAAHRAGFFNARTWRFGLRTAIQRYVQNGGKGQNLNEFTRGFLEYWHKQFDIESFVSFFIAPNMTWMRAYENMVEKRKLGSDDAVKKLIADIEKRIAYEILLEYGLTSNIGRTLEKSRCSCLSYPKQLVIDLSNRVLERIANELGTVSGLKKIQIKRMVIGYLNIMAKNGAFMDPVFDAMLKADGQLYLISNDYRSWLPGRQSGRNTPKFIYEPLGKVTKKTDFDRIDEKKYSSWISKCADSVPIDVTAYCNIILEELVRDGIVAKFTESSKYNFYGISEDKVNVSDDVRLLTCSKCGTRHYVAGDNVEFWNGAPCLRNTCNGKLTESLVSSLDYYGKLFSTGDLVRINAREHTGLLDRKEREPLENNFKRSKDDAKLWDPNILSCTPTLEMGIDIGDLSTVVLCSVPPGLPQFQQRSGRAGRKDGNALTLVVSATKPHDLYFYADPADMISGTVTPPKVFLNAIAVLKRQFIAYCMDCWVKEGLADDAVPDKVGPVLTRLEKQVKDSFPFNFMYFVENNTTKLLNSFTQMFPDLDEPSEDELRSYARGGQIDQNSMFRQIVDAFNDLKKQRVSVSESIKELKKLISDYEKKPKDTSYEKTIKDLKAEEKALTNVINSIDHKMIYNFLSDEGLLPNYAFPESGVVLKAILIRDDDENTNDQKVQSQKHKTVYEYVRSAASAITEFAPNNKFYAGGHEHVIDRIDLSSAQAALWRLCPNCSYAQIEESGKNTASCPRCGTPSWKDIGQLRNMLKVQMVYSKTDWKDMISDESDDRSPVFYTKQLLVDIDEDHNIKEAYKIETDEFSFGYEFVTKATLREINFGEKDIQGDKVTISGREDVRKGFKICKHCGRIQTDGNNNSHMFYCSAQRQTSLEKNDFEESLFIYREFSTEALRITIPSTTLDSTTVRTESFVAAFMLGMNEYFGNVDHLRATVCEVPVSDQDYRRKYLVIYDSIPGGTGYLKQLMNERTSLIDVLEKSLKKLEECSCKEDPNKDGCYHCLFTYRQSKNIGDISRKTAIKLLRTIISGKESLEPIQKLSSISDNRLLDSELERRFIEAMARMGSEKRKVSIEKAVVQGKEGYVLKINGSTWEIAPQVSLGSEDGVAVNCRPDFIFYPVGKSDRNPVAVFTDGFSFHHEKVADDTLKREAIRRSGRFRVWSFSWQDVDSVFNTLSDYATKTLLYQNMPSGSQMYNQVVRIGKAEQLKPDQISALDLFMFYLDTENAEQLFHVHAQAYSCSILKHDMGDFDDWRKDFEIANEKLHLTDDLLTQENAILGRWIPRTFDQHNIFCAGVLKSALQVNSNAPIHVFAIFDDLKQNRTDHYQEEWNGFWHFVNVMQFSESFAALTRSGIESDIYYDLLPYGTESTVGTQDLGSENQGEWTAVKELISDATTVSIIEFMESHHIPVPEDVGYELADDSDEIIAEIELAWTDRRIGFMTGQQAAQRSNAETAGWKIFTSEDEIMTLFGEQK